jgi:bifunctional non-homologous end joining protein LigD
MWTLCKQADLFARSRGDKCILEEWPNSVSTGRTMEEIVRDWTKPKDKYERQRRLFDEK